MKSLLAWCFLISVVASVPVSAGGADKLAKREKLTCAQLRSIFERHSLKVTPGSWGELAQPLRKLPAGAELCGVGSQGQVIIVSAALNKDLEKHYAPLFAEVGCKPLKCNDSTPYSCSCAGPGYAAGTLAADFASEHYVIMYVQPKKK